MQKVLSDNEEYEQQLKQQKKAYSNYNTSDEIYAFMNTQKDFVSQCFS